MRGTVADKSAKASTEYPHICIRVIPFLCGNKDKLGASGAHRADAGMIVINRPHFREEGSDAADAAQLRGSGSEASVTAERLGSVLNIRQSALKPSLAALEFRNIGK